MLSLHAPIAGAPCLLRLPSCGRLPESNCPLLKRRARRPERREAACSYCPLYVSAHALSTYYRLTSRPKAAISVKKRSECMPNLTTARRCTSWRAALARLEQRSGGANAYIQRDETATD